MQCRFCDSTALSIAHRGVSHPKRREHGPWDIYACKECGSLSTWPLPTAAQLDALYGSFDGGVESKLRDLRAATPLSEWFTSVAQRVTGLARASGAFRWIDVGAGGGELAAIMARQFPQASGVAIDWAERPATLDPAVEWLQADLNADELSVRPAQLVISLSVWEHVTEPARFVEKLVRLVAPGGLLYLVCPDAGSKAARMLGTRWPYFLPGEHLNMPTLEGARRCAEAAARDITVEVAPIGLPYPPAYVAGFLGLDRIAKLARKLPSVALPVGALEAVCRR